MACNYYIDGNVNCIFLRHFDDYQAREALKSISLAILDPDYRQGMNILRDMTGSNFPESFNFVSLKETGNIIVPDVDRAMGKCKLAIVVNCAKDFATAHQMAVATRMIGTNVERKPFRDMQKARDWLEIPDQYQIRY